MIPEFPVVLGRERKLNTNLFFSNFSGATGISRQNPGISRPKSLISLAPRDISNFFFLAPTRSLGRPLPHWKISGPKSLGLGSFFLPWLGCTCPGMSCVFWLSMRNTPGLPALFGSSCTTIQTTSNALKAHVHKDLVNRLCLDMLWWFPAWAAWLMHVHFSSRQKNSEEGRCTCARTYRDNCLYLAGLSIYNSGIWSRQWQDLTTAIFQYFSSVVKILLCIFHLTCPIFQVHIFSHDLLWRNTKGWAKGLGFRNLLRKAIGSFRSSLII